MSALFKNTLNFMLCMHNFLEVTHNAMAVKIKNSYLSKESLWHMTYHVINIASSYIHLDHAQFKSIS